MSYRSHHTLRHALLAGCTGLSSLIAGQALAQATSPGAASPPATAASAGSTLGEVVVTAQRRVQTIQNVPYNITAVSPTTLSNAGAAGVNDLSRVVSGLGVVDDGPGRGNENNFALRGLRTDSPGEAASPTPTVSTVATYYGETPVFFPLLLKDLERVEILRGPQGTLYGSGAEGGAIRFIPNRPAFSGFHAEVNGSLGFTDRAQRGNGSIDGMINIPILDRLALRVFAADESLGGFIDGVDRYVLGAGGVPTPSVPGQLTSGPIIGPVDKAANNSQQTIGRAALRWDPIDRVDLELSYLHQRTHADSDQTTNPNYVGKTEDLSKPGKSSLYPNASFQTRSGGPWDSTAPYRAPYTSQIDLAAATASIDFGFATLTSATSYYETRSDVLTDLTAVYLPGTYNFLGPYLFYPRFTARTDFPSLERGLVQELRLVSPDDKPLSYVLGLYYEKKRLHTDLEQSAPGVDAFTASLGAPSANPQLPDMLYVEKHDNIAEDTAAFGELTYKITPKWHVTGGFRVFHDTFTTHFVQQFPYSGAPYGDGVSPPIALGTTAASAGQSVSDHVFKANTSYDVSPDLKFYATYSRGFRRGGANGLPINGPFASLPQYLTYKPDYADNYEVGVKGAALDHRLRYSLDAFYINLENFQFNGLTPSILRATFNGNQARSEGIEAETTVQATNRLNLTLGYTYTDAVVTKGSTIYDLQPYGLYSPGQPLAVAASIKAGSLLPGVSHHTVTASADYNAAFVGDSRLRLHIDANYHSEQNGLLDTTSSQFWRIPGVVMSNARVTYDPHSSWTLALFVNNLTDAIAYTGGGLGPQTNANLYTTRVVSRPRTVGLAFHYAY